MESTILVVDDEQKLRDVIALFLKNEGFTVLEAENGKQALELFRAHNPDLVILDIMLPDISGFEVCKIIRQSSDIPVIYLTALDDDDHHMLGYKTGADDYVAKPFKASILAMKAKRMLEKNGRPDKPDVLKVQGVSLNVAAHVCTIDNEEIGLTSMEFSLLKEFIDNAGRVLSRDFLLNTLWGYEYEGETRVVDSMVKKLRKKLGPYSGLIKTVVSVGYKLESDT